MECCVGVSIETVLQIVELYTEVNNLKKTDASDCSPSSEWMDEGLQSETSVFLKLFTTV